MAKQSDPLLNPNFRRRWSGPPLKRISPRTTGIVQGLEFKVGSSEKDNSLTESMLQAAFRLDRLADQELAIGRVTAAERLAHEAQALREAVR
jgi:hypothetical protein